MKKQSTNPNVSIVLTLFHQARSVLQISWSWLIFDELYCGKTKKLTLIVSTTSTIFAPVIVEPCRDKFNHSTSSNFRSSIRIQSSVSGELDFCLELILVAIVVLEISPVVFNTDRTLTYFFRKPLNSWWFQPSGLSEKSWRDGNWSSNNI